VSDAIEFYWRPGCPFCIALRSRLRRSRIPVREVNIWADPDAAARVRGVAGGNETVPTVFVGERALVNPNIKQVIALVRETAPHLLDEAEAGQSRRRFWPFR
jgi:mycoredoxin